MKGYDPQPISGTERCADQVACHALGQALVKQNAHARAGHTFPSRKKNTAVRLVCLAILASAAAVRLAADGVACHPGAAAAEAAGEPNIKMVILRPTRKLALLLPATGIIRTTSDAALGDWYVNRIVVDRQPLLLLVSSASLLPMLLPARDVRGLPGRLAGIVKARLRRCDVDPRAIEAEMRAMVPVEIGPTVDRSVLGIMVDFAKSVPYHLEPGQWNERTLQVVEQRLAATSCHAGRPFSGVIFPDKRTPEVLGAKWLTKGPLQPTSGVRGKVH